MSHNNGDFVAELLAKQKELSKVVASKKTDLATIDNEQKKLAALLDSEKHSANKPKDHKIKHHAPNQSVRSDIQKNEAKFKEQAQKIAALRKELQHLESELKSINHDLQVVSKAS